MFEQQKTDTIQDQFRDSIDSIGERISDRSLAYILAGVGSFILAAVGGAIGSNEGSSLAAGSVIGVGFIGGISTLIAYAKDKTLKQLTQTHIKLCDELAHYRPDSPAVAASPAPGKPVPA